MIKLIKWLSHKMGYKIAMIKIGGEVPSITINGDKELLRYVTSEQLKELGITINVDVTDCKNFKEASKVQDQIINGDVKINIIKNKS